MLERFGSVTRPVGVSPTREFAGTAGSAGSGLSSGGGSGALQNRGSEHLEGADADNGQTDSGRGLPTLPPTLSSRRLLQSDQPDFMIFDNLTEML